MKLLFVHQNFPGQFKHLAPALVARGHEVRSLSMRAELPPVWEGVRTERYRVDRGSTAGIHPWLSDFETKVIRGEAAYRHALQLRDQGFRPDVLVAHPGWGESLFLKDVWPEARLGMYCEYFYRAEGADVGFDPEFSSSDGSARGPRMAMKNLSMRLHFDLADAAWAPTRWQADSYPAGFRERIEVIHDGIDTAGIAPRADVSVVLGPGGPRLTRADEVITFVNRNLEPSRGYHVFMRTLPELLRRRPRARVLIIGGDGASYGPMPREGTWKERFAAEARGAMPAQDWARVHFLGRVPHSQFVALLQLSRLHVYLTYPFVLSWSLLEAMSAGCAILASAVDPVTEVLTHGENARLVGFFDREALVGEACELLDAEAERQRLGARARSDVVERYDLARVCLPRQLAWVDRLAAHR